MAFAFSSKEIARSLCPPLLWKLLARVRAGKLWDGAREHETFSGVYANFANVEDQKPWTSAAYLEASRYSLRHYAEAAASPSATSLQALLALIINGLPANRMPRVLDWAGGSGLRYRTVRPGLMRPVHWQVVDRVELAAVGREIMGVVDQPVFADVLPPASPAFDIVLIYASLHYVETQSDLLKTLAAYRPKFIVLARLMALPDDSYVTRQNICGLQVPCKVSNLTEITGALKPAGYNPILMIQDGRDLTPLFGNDIPERRRVTRESLVVFRYDGGPSSPQI